MEIWYYILYIISLDQPDSQRQNNEPKTRRYRQPRAWVAMFSTRPPGFFRVCSERVHCSQGLCQWAVPLVNHCSYGSHMKLPCLEANLPEIGYNRGLRYAPIVKVFEGIMIFWIPWPGLIWFGDLGESATAMSCRVVPCRAVSCRMCQERGTELYKFCPRWWISVLELVASWWTMLHCKWLHVHISSSLWPPTLPCLLFFLYLSSYLYSHINIIEYK